MHASRASGRRQPDWIVDGFCPQVVAQFVLADVDTYSHSVGA